MPSQRSWLERTSRATAAERGCGGDDALADQRVAADELPLARRRAGRAWAGWRRGSRPCRCRAARRRGRICSTSSAPRPRRRAVASASSATPSRWAKSSGIALAQRPDEHVLASGASRTRPRVLLRVHALVGDPQRLGRVHRLAREHDRAVGAGDGEALAALGQRACGARDDRVGDLVARVEERAELVAAHPERAAAAGQVGREVAAEADEQRVAGGVAEGVVVVLEAVEVEQDEHERVGVVGLGQHALEVAGQRAAVAEPGQRVRHRLVARRAQDRDVVAEGQHQPRHHRDEREGGQRDRERVEAARQP